MIRIALNGFGRIGKNFLRAYLDDVTAQKHFTIVAINIGPVDIETVAYMIKFDSLLNAFNKEVVVHGPELLIDRHKIILIQELDASKLPWVKLAIDLVVDATGRYTHADQARQHIASGAKKVVITAPAHHEDITIVMGVNHHEYNGDKHDIISLGSCTTNALAPLIHVMKLNMRLESIIVNTVHAYTNNQALLDVNPHVKDVRTSRAAALNIIPTTTGAAISLATVFPEYRDFMAAQALRVPTPIVSLADITCVVDRVISAEQIDSWFCAAEDTFLKNIVATTAEKLVSTDFQGNSHSVIFDRTLTLINGRLIRLHGWYDNEWAYSNRIKDFLIIADNRIRQ